MRMTDVSGNVGTMLSPSDLLIMKILSLIKTKRDMLLTKSTVSI